MKLYYTPVSQDLTKGLADLAQGYAQEGYRVFYLAPNSLSFEKENKVLRQLDSRASFAITVTRFSQLARYLLLKTSGLVDNLDSTGLTMVVHRALSQLADGQLQVYGQLRRDRAFVQQLVDFYQECQAAQLAPADLVALAEAKRADLGLIFAQVNQLLGDLGKTSQSPLSQLIAHIQGGQLDDQLAQTVVLVDGFTRFTAEEKALLTSLNQRCHDLVIGVYASQKAYQANHQLGNLYQASLDFLRGLAQEFATRPTLLAGQNQATFFSDLTARVEGQFDYSLTEEFDGAVGQDQLQIWEALSPKQELEEVAKSIRRHLAAGHRYKDMLVLVGQMAAYQGHLKQVFDRYAIPYYVGQAEPMASHPLVQLVESLERLVRYNFRAEDWINLVTSGLYGQTGRDDLDQLTRYVTYADLKGRQAFTQPFKRASQRFDLDWLNQMMAELMAPLEAFLAHGRGNGRALLTAFEAFVEASQLRANLADLAGTSTPQEADRHGQVWKTFGQLLNQFYLIFADTDLTLADFLSLLSAGLQEASYRLVPATVDVVTIKSYQLIEPHTNKFVYALGLSQANFPEVVVNTSLVSDEERLLINRDLPEGKALDISSQDNLKRHHYIFASLLNAASQELVLSSPSRGEEGEVSPSTYLTLLTDLGLVPVRFGLSSQTPTAGDLGSYGGLLAAFARRYQDGKEIQEDQQTGHRLEQVTDWLVLARVLKKVLEAEGLPAVSEALMVRDEDSLQTQPLSKEVLDVRYPADQALALSASALMDFYNNQYRYFVRHVLRLAEEESIHPDARHHGIFLHRVLERLTKEHKEVTSLIKEVGQEPFAQLAYENNAQDLFSRELLEEMLVATAAVIDRQAGVIVEQEELGFDFKKDNQLTLSDGRLLTIRGKIDRLDRLDTKPVYGVVDYKSGANRFSLSDFYNRLSPQLLTYLSALRASGRQNLYGAFYLQVTKPQVSLTDKLTGDSILKEVDKVLTYKGLINSDYGPDLAGFPLSERVPSFSPEELDLLLAYNERLYQEAAEVILSGRFAINPYTRDGRSVEGDQLKSLTRFEADAHLGQARKLEDFGLKSNSKDFREKALGAMRQQLKWPSPQQSDQDGKE